MMTYSNPGYSDLLIMSYISDAPKKITYEPKFKTYIVGSEITCSADGNPAPQFTWISKYGQ